MARHTATVLWQRRGAAFVDNRYSRGHLWQFDGAVEVPASSSPHVVPVPMSVPAAVDPEEAFVASLASCHMLWFLSLAAGRGLVVDAYRDEAVGTMAPDAEGKLAITQVTLKPGVTFDGAQQPCPELVTEIHDQAHEQCFIANSVKTQVHCEPVFTDLRGHDTADRQLLRQFENCTLPIALWNHTTHVKVAFLYLRDHSFDVALVKMCSGIKAYNAANQIPEGPLEGYNETTTHAFLRLIRATMSAYECLYPTRDADSFCRTHPQLLSKHLLRLFYSPERRSHPDAKTHFVEPDLSPLPPLGSND